MAVKMKRARRYIFLVIGICAIALLTFFVILWNSFPDFSPTRNTYEVNGSDDSLYINGMAWGITGDHQIWWVTSQMNSEEADSLTDYIFPGLSPFFYKLIDDTLIVYTRRAAMTPTHFISGIAVKQIVLSNPQMMDLYITKDSLGLKEATFRKE
jgi:hypothetical protein